VIIGLLGAALAALCYGVGSVLQAIGARRTTESGGLDPRLMMRLVKQLPYVVGLVLDGIGFLGAVVALRTLPLFLVQSAIAGSVGVTAIMSVFVLHARLKRNEILALLMLFLGLVLLGVSAQPESAKHLGTAGVVWLYVGLVVVIVLGVVSGRYNNRAGAAGLAAAAGLGFGGVGISARVLEVPNDIWRILLDPVLWALAIYGVLSLLLFATALQRGSVTSTSAITFAVETVVPALIGIVFLGDRARPGLDLVAVAGFVLTVAGSIALASYGEVEPSHSAVAATT
jgi:drug/metabolite transporter (DMT)-like permease